MGAIDQPVETYLPAPGQQVAGYWTYPVRADVAGDLELPFNLYLYERGKIEYAVSISDYRTVAGRDACMETPWPDITSPDLIGKLHEDANPEKKFKTWIRTSGYQKLPRSLTYSDFQILYRFSPNRPPCAMPSFPSLTRLEQIVIRIFFLSGPTGATAKACSVITIL